MIAAGRIDPQPWMTSSAVRALIAALEGRGAPARFVGGCVRDGVLGRAVKDIDIATAWPPQDVIGRLAAAGIRSVPTGLAHGTVTAVIDRVGYEVTTLRRDVETDGRRAVVAFTDDWAADAARRDFTMNALYCDPDGTIYDPAGGLVDLRAGRVRFVGQPRERIAEDMLRLLRFFRFHAWYGKGAPDPDALAACREMAPRLPDLSAERVWAEISTTLLAPDPAAVFALMDESGTLAHVLGEAREPRRLAAAAGFEDRLGLAPAAVRRLAAMIECPTGDTARLSDRLRMSRAEAGRLAAAVGHAARLAADDGESAIRRALYRWGAPAFGDALVVAGAAGTGSPAAWRAHAAALAVWTQPVFPLAGGDVLAAGVPAGPRIGGSLSAVEDWWLDEGFAPDRDACLARLARLIAG